MNKRGFTLIELMMVVTIIALISTVGVFSFISISQERVFRDELSTLLSRIEQYESNLKNQISDYQFDFYVGKDYYIHTYNKNYSEIEQTLSQSGENLVLRNNFSGTGFYIIDEFRDDKYFTQHILSATGSIEIEKILKGEYAFYSQINTTRLNPLFLSFYSNFDFDESGENIFLDKISGTSLTGASLKGDISHNRQYFINDTQTGSFSLDFEKNGKIYNLEFNH